MTTIYECDRCSARLKDREKYLRIDRLGWKEFIKSDLCNKCAKAFKDFMEELS